VGSHCPKFAVAKRSSPSYGPIGTLSRLIIQLVFARSASARCCEDFKASARVAIPSACIGPADRGRGVLPMVNTGLIETLAAAN
jgi:hypothetical protein